MPDKDPKSLSRISIPERAQGRRHPDIQPDQLDALGGEPLEGSGFEEELPEPDSEWRDPR